MTTAHTPGPWVAHFGEAYFVAGPDMGRVAMMMNLKGDHGLGGRRSGAESAANCRLIAAAPDMLQALAKAREELACGNVNSAAERIAHAIERATGGAA